MATLQGPARYELISVYGASGNKLTEDLDPVEPTGPPHPLALAYPEFDDPLLLIVELNCTRQLQRVTTLL